MSADPWADILDEDEEIIWQGQPEPGISFGRGEMAGVGFGVLFSGFALFWMILVYQAGELWWMFGLIHFAAGIGLIVASTVWPARMRLSTWYTLTSKRAFIAKKTFTGRKTLKSYPITQHTGIETELGPLGAVYFASETYKSTDDELQVRNVGFERLPNVAEVARLMRDIQKENQ